MTYIEAIKRYVKSPYLLIARIIRCFPRIFSDKLYLTLLYRGSTGEWINWSSPQTFNEKLQWLKIYNRKEEYGMMVDKNRVKEYVANKIGKEYVIPTLAHWDKAEKIDLNSLPNEFVLKTTHGGGGQDVIICRDKEKLDLDKAKNKMAHSMRENNYPIFREWPYTLVKKSIIAEKFLQSENGELKDYKFFCFNGKPRFFKVDFGRFVEHHANYYDLDWNLLPFGEANFPPVPDHVEERPKNFDKMVEIVKTLAKGIPFVRIDLYNIEGQIYFGEITFFPASGLGRFTDKEWERKVGSMIQLPGIGDKV